MTESQPIREHLFKWSNPFSWSYNGDLADSIRERVKRAGGNVTGDLCCRLAWYNYDDLDLHMFEVINNRAVAHIHFADRAPRNTSGQLDVDMNAGGPRSREPVENIYYPHKSRMKPGTYLLKVHNYNKRETSDVGFETEIDTEGEVLYLSYPNAVPHNAAIDVAQINFDGSSFEVIPQITSRPLRSKEIWGLRTNEYHRVNALMLSPNHWTGNAIGNKHYFFFLDKCQNTDGARPFFNEFLRQDLDSYRKVFEIVGGKLKTAPAQEQLSGLGFSSTKPTEIILKVTSNSGSTRVLKVEI